MQPFTRNSLLPSSLCLIIYNVNKSETCDKAVDYRIGSLYVILGYFCISLEDVTEITISLYLAVRVCIIRSVYL